MSDLLSCRSVLHSMMIIIEAVRVAKVPPRALKVRSLYQPLPTDSSATYTARPGEMAKCQTND